MVRAIMVLLLCQLGGTIIQEGTGLPVPGPVLGLVILLAVLIRQGGPSADLAGTAQGLLKYLGLLFVPAGVGVITELPVLRDNAVAILVSIAVSTIIGLGLTGVLMQLLLKNAADA